MQMAVLLFYCFAVALEVWENKCFLDQKYEQISWTNKESSAEALNCLCSLCGTRKTYTFDTPSPSSPCRSRCGSKRAHLSLIVHTYSTERSFVLKPSPSFICASSQIARSDTLNLKPGRKATMDFCTYRASASHVAPL